MQFHIPTFLDDPNYHRRGSDVELGLLHRDGRARSPSPRRSAEDEDLVPLPPMRQPNDGTEHWLRNQRLLELVVVIRLAHDEVILRVDDVGIKHNAGIRILFDLYETTTLKKRLPREIAEDWSLKRIEGHIEKYKRLRNRLERMPVIEGRPARLDEELIQRGETPRGHNYHLHRTDPWRLFSLGKQSGSPRHLLSSRQMKRYGLAADNEEA